MLSSPVHHLNEHEIQRYINLYIIRCFTCCAPLPPVVTPDDYIACDNCGAKHDLLLHRPEPVDPSRRYTVKTLDVNGRLRSRIISAAEYSQISLPL